MITTQSIQLRTPLRFGIIAGVVSVCASAIGLVVLFDERELIAGVITMGQILIFAPTAALAYIAARDRAEGQRGIALLYGSLTGVISGIPSALLILLASAVNLRQFMPNVSPALIEILSFGLPPVAGSLAFLAAMTAVGLIAASFSLLPSNIKRPIFNGLLWTFTVGLFSENISNRVRFFFGQEFNRLIFTGKALSPFVAALIFFLAAGLTVWQGRRQTTHKKPEDVSTSSKSRRRWMTYAGVVITLLILPLLLGSYLSEVLNNVGLFILMGLGLNIVVGFAGLLDLGYVAFYAIGAYSMAVMTSQGPLGFGLSFWAALPFCVLIAAFAGLMLGLPVLRMRGDYLAIVTLAFGEIIRILVLSDLLKPVLGGAQGILKIPKPEIFGLVLKQPEQFYFVILAGVLIAWFVSWRLSKARLGRQWLAMQEDEDVAEAMGIRLVTTKLLAFSFGAAFSGLAGALLASKLTSIFPHSFKLEISINVLVLIIIGGLGSLPGVVIGALILVGLPELLREFAEYRLLMYGLLMIVMMLAKPEGFWPSQIMKRELHIDEESEMLSAEAGD
ncbi:MAG: branched-chain amino acid ABC transporter permease [Anaerolineales bacterium]